VLSKDLLRFVKNRYPGSVTCCFIDGIVVKNKLFFVLKHVSCGRKERGKERDRRKEKEKERM
jgi:hypothetical protein